MSIIKHMLRILMGSAAAAAFITASTAVPASAHGFKDCTKDAKETWKAQPEAEAAATAAGYTVSKSKIAGSCYEVYAKDKDGKMTIDVASIEAAKK